MYVSQRLKKQSIAEYVLYMWQVEDIIRAYDCSLARLKREYLSQFDYPPEEAEDLIDWYGNLIRMVNQEGCRAKGHLAINRVIVEDLNDFHLRLLDSPKFPFYRAEYYKVLPFIVELRNRGDKEASEVETCLNALYGVLMLRLQKRDITPDTRHAIDEISTLMGMLSDYYLKDKQEGIEWE